jgi:hypothetical protein
MVGLAGRLPTPFFCLACRILNICANSATVFGATLTKLRNRLGVKTLTARRTEDAYTGRASIQRNEGLV